MNCLSGRRRGEPLLLATFTASPSLPPFFLVHDLALPSEQHRRRRRKRKKGGGSTEISNHKLEETGKEGEGENGARPSSSIALLPLAAASQKNHQILFRSGGGWTGWVARSRNAFDEK